ncbi:helix-turn-helix domain-containing protein [Sutcliffiella horikoshii]|uniref:helix-turn-helix transcriptional regulator n=1 Tax=Sutcliffiella TaxID=2837511 RepID=UPI0009EEAD15|nr:helix-turn-helix domain-containing protein [Sutcliffiella horikoshii]MCM3620469.1 helix-turn-helix domain-containing protein [Sutcliffiella horikoshii]
MHSIREIEDKLLELHLESVIQKAYEQGVSDGVKKFSRPELLTNSDLADMFQIANSTVMKMTSDPTFPRSKAVKARYPRDLVYKWIEQNSNWIEQNTNYFNREAIG